MNYTRHSSRSANNRTLRRISLSACNRSILALLDLTRTDSHFIGQNFLVLAMDTSKSHLCISRDSNCYTVFYFWLLLQ